MRLALRITKRDYVWLGLLAGAALFWWHSTRPINWTEDVLLSDGTTVKVRVNVYGDHPYGEIGGPGGAEADAHELAGLEVVGIAKPWRGTHGAAIKFDKTSEGEWYVISAVISCEDVWSLGHPQSPYLEFRYRNGDWVRVTMRPQRVGEKANLMFIDTKQHGHYTLEQKRAIRGGQGPIGKYDQIVANWRSKC